MQPLSTRKARSSTVFRGLSTAAIGLICILAPCRAIEDGQAAAHAKLELILIKASAALNGLTSEKRSNEEYLYRIDSVLKLLARQLANAKANAEIDYVEELEKRRSEFEARKEPLVQKQRRVELELGRLNTHTTQLGQYSEHRYLALMVRDDWNPRQLDFIERCDLAVTFNFTGLPLKDCMAFLTEATGVDIEFVSPVKPESARWGQTFLALGATAVAVLLLIVLVRAARERRWPRYSLRWLLGLTICLGLGIHGFIRWKKAAAGWQNYEAAVKEIAELREKPVKLNVRETALKNAVEAVSWFVDGDVSLDEKQQKFLIHPQKFKGWK